MSYLVKPVKWQRATDENRIFADIIAGITGQPQDDDDWHNQ